MKAHSLWRIHIQPPYRSTQTVLCWKWPWTSQSFLPWQYRQAGFSTGERGEMMKSWKLWSNRDSSLVEEFSSTLYGKFWIESFSKCPSSRKYHPCKGTNCGEKTVKVRLFSKKPHGERKPLMTESHQLADQPWNMNFHGISRILLGTANLLDLSACSVLEMFTVKL